MHYIGSNNFKFFTMHNLGVRFRFRVSKRNNNFIHRMKLVKKSNCIVKLSSINTSTVCNSILYRSKFYLKEKGHTSVSDRE